MDLILIAVISLGAIGLVSAIILLSLLRSLLCMKIPV